MRQFTVHLKADRSQLGLTHDIKMIKW